MEGMAYVMPFLARADDQLALHGIESAMISAGDFWTRSRAGGQACRVAFHEQPTRSHSLFPPGLVSCTATVFAAHSDSAGRSIIVRPVVARPCTGMRSPWIMLQQVGPAQMCSDR